jgi:hypothetical protein
MLTLTVACGGSGGGGSSTVSPYGYGYGVTTGCANCFANATMIGQTSSYSPTGDAQLSLQIYGQNSGSTYSYYGPVEIQGTLQINTPYNISFCYAPAGTYTLSTYQPGVMSGNQLGGIVLIATGPATIQMNVSSGILLSNGTMGMYFVSTINGQYCPLTVLQ